METCPLHPNMREDITNLGKSIGDIKESMGEIRGRQDLQILALDEIKKGVKDLAVNGNQMKIDQAVEQAKLSPFFWLVSVVIVAIVTGGVAGLIHYLWR